MTIKELAYKELEAIEILNGGKDSYIKSYIKALENELNPSSEYIQRTEVDKIDMKNITCNLCSHFVPAMTGNWHGCTPVCTEIKVCPTNKGFTTTLFNCTNARGCRYFKLNNNPNLEGILTEGMKLVYATGFGKSVFINVIK